MTENLFDFLGEQEESMPEGSGVFKNTGFIGPVMAVRKWKFWSGDDLALYETGLTSPEDYTRDGKDGSYFYYFSDEENAKIAKKALKAFNPQLVWVIATPKRSIKNTRSENALEKWSEFIGADCSMTTLASGNNRHHLHMIMAPALIQAFAGLAGDVKSRLWHLDEILLGIDDAEITSEFSDRMIGNRDATNEDEDKMAQILDAVNGDLHLAQSIALGKKDVVVPEQIKDLFGKVKIHYTASILWQRRAALWAALGEPDAKKYIIEGMAETEDGKKYETTAPMLKKYLGIVSSKWTKPIWGRLHLISDFRKGAVSKKSGKRWSIPVISEVWATEADAQAAADTELEDVVDGSDTSQGQGAQQNKTNTEFPSVPENWFDSDGNPLTDPWKETVANEKEKLGGNLPNMPQLVALAQTLSATPDDLKAWWDHV